MANGTPRSNAVDDTNQRALPANQRLDEPKPAAEETLEEIQPRAVGGTMSRRAERRSARVSSVGSYSESVEISESFACQCLCSFTRFILILDGLRLGLVSRRRWRRALGSDVGGAQDLPVSV